MRKDRPNLLNMCKDKALIISGEGKSEKWLMYAGSFRTLMCLPQIPLINAVQA